MSASETLKQNAKSTVRRARPWIEPLARLGYAAKGIVYLIIGLMAARFSVGRSSNPGDFSSALLQVFRQPFGEILLLLLTVGLFGYGFWCFIQAAMDTEDKGTTIFGIVIRVFYAGVGIVYWAIAWSAVQLLMRISTVTEGDRSEQQWTARLFAISPVTRWFAIVIGIGFLGFCIYEIRRLYIEGIEILRPEGRKQFIDTVAMHLGQIGIIARAGLFVVIGVFLIWSGITFDPSKVRGISGALREVQREPHGTPLLIAMAIGLIAYGVYMLLLAWRRRIPT